MPDHRPAPGQSNSGRTAWPPAGPTPGGCPPSPRCCRPFAALRPDSPSPQLLILVPVKELIWVRSGRVDAAGRRASGARCVSRLDVAAGILVAIPAPLGSFGDGNPEPGAGANPSQAETDSDATRTSSPLSAPAGFDSAATAAMGSRGVSSPSSGSSASASHLSV